MSAGKRQDKPQGAPGDPLAGFRQRLDECHAWPCAYSFKFIAPHGRAKELERLVEGARVTRRPSSSGTYVSITATVEVGSADEVLDVYEKASKIEGVITL
ncbi:MAG: DUF493 domain-containing protein [Desulfovibrionaceae bacterium]|jgi:putative lipoic acid-binding regulatory protein|nr:DUF493 domain-containing protein [Desulfovibrionaceae bacterium]